MRHAGIHWPENAGGEHPDREAIASLPGMQGAALICSPSARYHYDFLRRRCPNAAIVWRAIPRQDRLPAQLGWDARRVADECLNLWDEQPHGGTEWFLPLNELQFEKEDGGPFPGYGVTALNLHNLRIELRRRLGADIRLMFPAWVPGDDIERAREWEGEARHWDAVCLHAYGAAEEIRERYDRYRELLGPSMPIFVGEWNANHTGADEGAALAALAAISDADPAFLGATYYIYETRNAGEGDLSIWGNPDRLALFRDPPTVSSSTPPQEPIMPEPRTDPAAMPTVDAWQHFTPELLAEACMIDDVAAVTTTWEHVVPQLALAGINRLAVQIAVAGTIAHETASRFYPVREGVQLGEEDGAAEAFRKTLSYYPLYGRGLDQCTGLGNYRAAGPAIADLWGTGPDQPDFRTLTNPDLLLDLDMSSAHIAVYFRDARALPTPSWPAGYSLQNACDLGDDDWIRRLVVGGRDPVGQARIARVRAVLTGVPGTHELAYAPTTPPERQVQDWVCSIRTATWILKSLGVDVDAGRMQDEMVPGTVTPAKGLLDARGYGLAAILGRHLPAGTRIEVIERCTWDDLAARAGRGPIGLGSGDPRLYHWLAIADVIDADSFSAPNPAPNYPKSMALGDVLSRDEFETYAGSWSAVFVEVIPPTPTPAIAERPVAKPDLGTLVGVAYHEDGVLLPALSGARASGDWSQVDAVVDFLRKNNPDRAA